MNWTKIDFTHRRSINIKIRDKKKFTKNFMGGIFPRTISRIETEFVKLG